MIKLKGISGLNIALGVLLLLGGGQGNGWMFQSGLVMLFSGLTLWAERKYTAADSKHLSTLKATAYTLPIIMTALFIIGFINGAWLNHPLGLILSFWGLASLVAVFTIRKLKAKNARTENSTRVA